MAQVYPCPALDDRELPGSASNSLCCDTEIFPLTLSVSCTLKHSLWFQTMVFLLCFLCCFPGHSVVFVFRFFNFSTGSVPIPLPHFVRRVDLSVPVSIGPQFLQQCFLWTLDHILIDFLATNPCPCTHRLDLCVGERRTCFCRYLNWSCASSCWGRCLSRSRHH